MNPETFGDDCLEIRQCLSLCHIDIIIALKVAADFVFELPVRFRFLKKKSSHGREKRRCRLATGNPAVESGFHTSTLLIGPYTKVET